MATSDKLANLAIELSLQNKQFIDGIASATKRLDEIGTSSRRAAKSISNVEKTMLLVTKATIAYVAITKTFDFAKSFLKAEESITNLEASFRVLLGSAERGADMLQRVYGIVESTGASFQTASEAVQRLAIGLTDLGATNQQIAQIAENFIKLGRVSGTSMQDINGALLQFTQGLASGRLQGDELRSIFERLPQVIQLIAKEMGVATGEVRKLGSEGKITAEIMSNALLKATEDINSQFSELEETAEQTFAKVGAEWTKAQAKLSKAFGFQTIIKGFATAVEFIVDAVGAGAVAIRRIVSSLAIYLGNQFTPIIEMLAGEKWSKPFAQAIKNIEQNLKDFNEEIAKLESVTAAKEIDTLTEAIVNQAKEMTKLEKALFDYEAKIIKLSDAYIPLQDKLDLINRLLAEGVINYEIYNQELAKVSKAYRELVVGSADPFEKYAKSIEELNVLMAKGIITVEEYNRAATKAMEELNKSSEKAMTEMEKNIQRLATDAMGGFIDQIFDADKKFSEFASNFLKEIAKMIVKQQVLNALQGTTFGGWLGFSQGGAFNSPTGLPQGVYNQPTFFPMPNAKGLNAFAQGGTFGTGVLGEAGAEAIMPLRRTTSGDLGVQGSPVNININNTVSDTTDVYAKATNKQDGSKEIEIIVERKVKESLNNGALDRSFSTNYGLKRRAM